MELISNLSPLLTLGIFLFSFGIFFIGFLSLLLVGFNSLLNAKIEPLKDNQSKLEAGQAKLEAKLDQLIANTKKS